jgi:hypothetical protein
LPAFRCLIRPFPKRLDVTIPFLFYAVPDDAPEGPATVFTDRFWDDREHYVSPGVGLVYRSLEPYWGPLPPAGLGTLEGTPDQWENGIDYDAWRAGAFSGATCWPLVDNLSPVRVRQAQDVSLTPAVVQTVCSPIPIPWTLLAQVRGIIGCAGQNSDIVLTYDPVFNNWQGEDPSAPFGWGITMWCDPLDGWLLRFSQASVQSFTAINFTAPGPTLHWTWEIFFGPWLSCPGDFEIEVFG